MSQLHKNFTDNEVEKLIERYIKGQIKRVHLEQILGIKIRRICELVKKYRNDPQNFSIGYNRTKPTRKISNDANKAKISEIEFEKGLIDDNNIPLKSYNYSYIKDRISSRYGINVSLSTVIDRAKKYGYYKKRKKKKVHDREVVTNYVGGNTARQFPPQVSPNAKDKWYLITSIDDYSRFMLYARLFKKETSWTHIQALEEVSLKYGRGYSYYVDCHSTFRFIQGRDSQWRKHYVITDGIDPQWKQLVEELGIEVIYALSPQAKGNGKIYIKREKLKNHIDGYRTES